MPRYNVPLPDGRWQIFSTVVDDFVTEPMSFDELRAYRRALYGTSSDRDTESLLTDKPTIDRMDYEEACERMRQEDSDA